MSGTFIIRPTQLLSGGVPSIDFDGPPLSYAGWGFADYATNHDILVAVNALDGASGGFWETLAQFPDAPTFTDTVRFGFGGASIYLDGNPTPIPFTSLPAGFTPLSATVKCDTNSFNIPTPPDSFTNFIQHANGDNSPPLAPGLATLEYAYSFSPLAPSILDIYSNGCGLKVVLTAGDEGSGVGAVSSGEYFNLRVEGTYNLQAASFQTQNINTPVHAGDTVSILTPSPADPHHPFDPTTLDSIAIQPSDGSSPIPVPSFDIVPDGDGFLIIFDWPDGMPDGVPVGYIIGTTFSGSVRLGLRITIFFTNASGIYELVPGKTTDTLYDVVDVTTVELAIPDPFAKTGYIGG